MRLLSPHHQHSLKRGANQMAWTLAPDDPLHRMILRTVRHAITILQHTLSRLIYMYTGPQYGRAESEMPDLGY